MLYREHYWTHSEQETAKEQAWLVVGDKENPIHQRASALLRVIEAHYWHARQALEAQPKEFLRKVLGKRYTTGIQIEIDWYTSNWLASMEGLRPFHEIAEETKYIIEEFGYKPERHRFMKPGNTTYTDEAVITRFADAIAKVEARS